MVPAAHVVNDEPDHFLVTIDPGPEVRHGSSTRAFADVLQLIGRFDEVHVLPAWSSGMRNRLSIGGIRKISSAVKRRVSTRLSQEHAAII